MTPSGPRITRADATEVVVHAREGYVDRPAFGPSLFDKGPKWLIELHSDDGLVGVGETPRNTGFGDVDRAVRCVLGRPVRSLAWARPVPPDYAHNDMFGHLDPPVPHRLYERDMGATGGMIGVEIAVQDLLGRLAGVRVCDLFGGPYREQVNTSWWMGRSDPEHAARQMAIGLELGFRAVKLKAAAEDDVVGIVAAIKRTAGDETPVVVDANRRFYRVSEALAIARRLESFANLMFEDPFPYDAQAWRLFRQKTSIPLVMHCTTETHVALAEGCCDHVNLAYPAQRFLGDAHMAARFGALCWAGSGVELGVLDAYMIHYASAARNCVLHGDAMGHCIRDDDLIETPLQVRDGAIALPEGPGLGVTLDHDAVAKFARRREQWDH